MSPCVFSAVCKFVQLGKTACSWSPSHGHCLYGPLASLCHCVSLWPPGQLIDSCYWTADTSGFFIAISYLVAGLGAGLIQY